jgi:hypothetical protein
VVKRLMRWSAQKHSRGGRQHGEKKNESSHRALDCRSSRLVNVRVSTGSAARSPTADRRDFGALSPLFAPTRRCRRERH